MPKDIRSYFGGGGSQKPAGDSGGKKIAKRSAEETIDITEEDGVPAKSQAKKAKTEKVATPSPRQAHPNKPPARSGGKAKSTPGKPKAAARRRVVESDSDDDYEGEKESEIEGDDVVVDLEDSDEESEPAPKKSKTTAKPAQPRKSTPKKTPPKSAAKSAAPAAKPAAVPKPKKSAKEEEPADVKAAIAAVDKAAAELPTLEPDLMAEGAVMGGAEVAPPNPGSKPVPRGHPECLKGKTFVITGVLDSLWRNEAEELIKRHSGRVTSAVSGRTSFLVRGSGAGKSKTVAAAAKGTKIIDEDGLMSLIRAAPEPEQAAVQPPPLAAASAKANAAAAELNRMPTSCRPAAAAGGQPHSLAGGADMQLWVEKYRPTSKEELVGNKALVETLIQWLKNWEQIHLHGVAPPAQSGRGKPKDLSKKAVLLSGQPGIGKTTAAMIATQQLGFQPVEINASDTRNRADTKITGGIGGKLANAIKEMATNSAINLNPQGGKKRICLIMDEVDGMSGGDRGGVTELIATIKSSRVPIICICNDKYNQKLRSLRNSTLELDFRKPTSQQITERVKLLCKLEGLQVNDATLDAVATGANGDIRLVLGQLQMIRLRARSLSYDEAKGKLATSKDADMSPFEAGRRLLSGESARMSLGDKTELVFQDMDLVPLLIQENYLNHRPSLAQSEQARLQLIAKAADLISRGDLVNRRVRQQQAWSLMPFAATVGSVAPASYMRGSRETFFPGEMNFPRFSAWLGQNSSQNKQRRLLGELHTRMTASGNCAADRLALRKDYLPTLRHSLVAPLVKQEREGIEAVVQQLQDYCMNKDDLEFVLSVTHFKGNYPWNEDVYKSVPTAVKSAFTRQLNSAVAQQKPRANVMVEEFKRKRGGKAAAAPDAEPEEVLGGDPELEAAAAAERKVKEEAGTAQVKEEEEEEELDAKDAAALAKKQAQLSRHGITFQSKAGPVKGRKAAASSKSSAASRGRGRGKK